MAKLNSAISKSAVQHLRSIFSCHGIPETILSDNGSQFASSCFQSVLKEYGFTHSTSSPKYQQANSAAERAVKTMKGLLSKNSNPYLAMLCHRATLLENGFIPAELLMGRKIRTTLPVLPKILNPQLPNKLQLQAKEKAIKDRQRRNFNNRHCALPNRSYLVETPHRAYRRNKRDLIAVPTNEPYDAETLKSTHTEDATEPARSSNDTGTVQTQSGKPPDRLIED